MSADPFDWSDAEVVAVEHQPAVAVYANAAGAVTIRQRDDARGEDEPFIVIQPEHAGAVARRLMEVSAELLAEAATVPPKAAFVPPSAGQNSVEAGADQAMPLFNATGTVDG